MNQKYRLSLLLLITNFALGLSQNSEVKNIIPTNFPSDCIVTLHCPSCETPDSLLFYPDRTFILVLGGFEKSQKHYKLGIWRHEGDAIIIEIYKKLGLRPVGDAINPDVRFASNPDDYFIYEEYVPYEEWLSETQTFENESLNHFDISLVTENKASQIKIDTNKYLANGQYKIASCRQITNNDLTGLSKQELRLIRNEIFARYGYQFKSIDLQKHFSRMSWYHGHATNVDTYLTDIEKNNIKLIRKFEQK
jgi:hypothetical protein